jgi:hypothetical protein
LNFLRARLDSKQRHIQVVFESNVVHKEDNVEGTSQAAMKRERPSIKSEQELAEIRQKLVETGAGL